MEQVRNDGLNAVQAEKPAKQEKERKPWKGVLKAVLIFAAILALQTGIIIISSTIYSVYCIAQAGGDVEAGTQLYMDKATNSGLVTYILAIATFLYGTIVVIWYKFGFVKKYTSGQWNEFRQRVLNGRTIAILVFAAIGCYCFDVLVEAVVAFVLPESAESFNNMMNVALGSNAAVTFLVSVILAPIAEEVALRGIILRTLIRNNCPVVAAIIIQAVLFGIFHLNIIQGLYVLPIGLVLGYTAYKCKSVLPCIFIHMLNNFLPNVIKLLPENAPIEVILVVTLVISLAVLYILGKNKAHKVLDKQAA